MVSAGVYVRVLDGRHDVAVVVVQDDDVVEHLHVPAPAGESESGQLGVLYVRTHELLRPHTIEIVVVWPPDPPPGGKIKLLPALAAGRAEGAVLAAAGELGLLSDRISGAGVRAAGGGSTDEAVDALCASITHLPSDPPVRRAVAAAAAWQNRNV